MEKHKTLTSIQCEELFFLSLDEVIASFGISNDRILEIINEGIISLPKGEYREWMFDNEACRRIRIVLQLDRDLGVNMAGAALALDLLKEIERLRLLLNHLDND